jgi:hypothetical protein
MGIQTEVSQYPTGSYTILKYFRVQPLAVHIRVMSLQTTEDGVCYGRYVSPGHIKAELLNLRVPNTWGYTIRGTWDDAEKPTWIAG